jgi:aspartate racemase
MVHADAPTLLANQVSGDVQAQVVIYDLLTRRLQDAGARSVAVTSIAVHFCIEAFQQVSVLPIIDLLKVVHHDVNALGYRGVGLLGTRGVMASRFYGALGTVQAPAPLGQNIDGVSSAYVTVASNAHCSDEQRVEAHVEAIVAVASGSVPE